MSQALSLAQLARSEIWSLRAYESARSLATEGAIFLDANESPVAPISFPSIHRYPEPQPHALLNRFSTLYSVPSSMLFVGRGSDEAIDLLIRIFCTPGVDQILICPPTYGMYEVCAKIQGAKIYEVPLVQKDNDFFLDREGIQRAISKNNSIKIIFICSPNNPTGTAFSLESIQKLCELTLGKCMIVLDEAYAEFSQFNEENSILTRLSQFSHLIILRTFSKAWALAGARCGVAIAEAPVIQLLQKVRAPYPLSAPSVKVILEATDLQRQDLLKQRVKAVRCQREALKSSLLELNAVQWVYASETNFLLVKFHHPTSVFHHLKSKGMILRDRSHELGLSGCIRITLGTEEENRLLITYLREIDS